MNDVLYVWIYPPEEPAPVLCGVLELVQGRRCLFSYAAAWVAYPKAFALSPDMPLRPGVIEPPGGLDLHPIFEDAGPDRWGKNIINKVFNPQRRSPLEYLALAGEDRIGTLGFSRSASVYQSADEQAFGATDLPDLLRAADALSAQVPMDDALRRLLRPGASAGGARPKAIIRHHNEDWIAKFPSPDDECDVCALEHASLRLAALCGIAVPASQLVKIGNRNALLVKRFDRAQDHRIHFASARTMLIAEGLAEDAMGYADLADVARRLSSLPKEDCHQLFRRMTFNVLIENTDDHNKNHAFLYQGGQWRLAPAYDIQPQLLGIDYHQLRIGKDGYAPTLANVLSEASRFLLKRDEAAAVVADIVQQVRAWQTVFAQAGVSQVDIDLCANYVLRPALFSS
jgi:serine/threonine-protein kinase HipA